MTDRIAHLQAGAVNVARAGDYSNALLLLERAATNISPGSSASADYIVILSWAGRHRDAILEFERWPAGAPCPDFLTKAAAKSYHTVGSYTNAARLYARLYAEAPNDTDALSGWANALAASTDFTEAIRLLEQGLARFPHHPALLFDLAGLHWQQGDMLRALNAYDSLLAAAPTNAAAINLKARVLADMGALSLAQEFIDTHSNAVVPEVRSYVNAGIGALYVQWGELDRAAAYLDRLAAKAGPNERQRLRWDRILALVAIPDMPEVIRSYEEMEGAGIAAPFWIHDAAASAYLYAREPEEALKRYRRALADAPHRFETRMGIYHALAERGDFRAAGEARARLERETPPWLIDRGVLRYSFNREGVTLAQPWWLAYQDRLAEAQAHFDAWVRVAPANLAARSGLAQVLQWRGRPAAARQEFDIVLTLAGSNLVPQVYAGDNEMAARNGRAAAMNSQGLRRDARAEVRALLERNPLNLHTRRLNHDLDIEDRPELRFDWSSTVEDPGAREDEETVTLSDRLTPVFDLYAYGLRRHTEGDDTYLVRRLGAGAHWLARPSLTLRAEGSTDIDVGSSAGWMGRFTWRINDSWWIESGYNSYSLSVPLRARAAGVDASGADLAVQYRPHESVTVRGVGAWQDYDDGNANRFYGLFAERALYTRAYLKTRIFGEISRSENARTDAGYFSPGYAMTHEVTHLIEHTVFRRYERSLVHRLYLGAGLFSESGYENAFIWDGRYEQDYRFDPLTGLLWGVLYKDRHYDGDRAQSTTWYLTFRRTF